mmetsp:Transcript_31439/g.76072  ORF Transcript_31439/g.76072 Transcript_31439/m.76072 type:complete len:269 (-) Transcript_31439:314-1120(-)
MLLLRLSPPVRSATVFKMNGVTSLLRILRSSASFRAICIFSSTLFPAGSLFGTATSIPCVIFNCRAAQYASATVSALSTRTGHGTPDDGEKKAGNSSVFHATVGTLFVSRTSSVRLMSRIDLTPALTTTTGVCASSVRSAEMSIVSSPPRWTPPVPPVTNVVIPARYASFIVAATVVAPHTTGRKFVSTVLLSGQLRDAATMRGMSRVEHFSARPSSPAFAKSSSSIFGIPTLQIPSRIATVAGMTACCRKIVPTSNANSKFWGYGIP